MPGKANLKQEKMFTANQRQEKKICLSKEPSRHLYVRMICTIRKEN